MYSSLGCLLCALIYFMGVFCHILDTKCTVHVAEEDSSVVESQGQVSS